MKPVDVIKNKLRSITLIVLTAIAGLSAIHTDLIFIFLSFCALWITVGDRTIPSSIFLYMSETQ